MIYIDCGDSAFFHESELIYCGVGKEEDTVVILTKFAKYTISMADPEKSVKLLKRYMLGNWTAHMIEGDLVLVDRNQKASYYES